MFTPGDKVILKFVKDFTMKATIVEKIDDEKVKPLTNYYLVKLDEGGQFGFSGDHIALDTGHYCEECGSSPCVFQK